MRASRKPKATKIIGWILFTTLVISVAYSIVRCIMAPAESVDGEPYQKLKSDYLLMVIQCDLRLKYAKAYNRVRRSPCWNAGSYGYYERHHRGCAFSPRGFYLRLFLSKKKENESSKRRNK